jgi:hypothetical protein
MLHRVYWQKSAVISEKRAWTFPALSPTLWYLVPLKFILMMSSHQRLHLLSDVLPFRVSDYNFVRISNLRCVLHVSNISPFGFWLSHQYPICIPLLPYSPYMPCLSHPPSLHQSNYIWRGVQVMNFLITQFSPISCLFISLVPNILFSTLYSNILILCSSINVRDQVSHPYKTKSKIIVLFILIFRI